jgi:Fe-S cluster biogenesis protein NfuA
VDFDEDEGLVQLRLMGHCVGCAASMMTLKHGIESRLKASVPEVKTVEAI